MIRSNSTSLAVHTWLPLCTGTLLLQGHFQQCALSTFYRILIGLVLTLKNCIGNSLFAVRLTSSDSLLILKYCWCVFFLKKYPCTCGQGFIESHFYLDCRLDWLTKLYLLLLTTHAGQNQADGDCLYFAESWNYNYRSINWWLITSRAELNHQPHQSAVAHVLWAVIRHLYCCCTWVYSFCNTGNLR